MAEMKGRSMVVKASTDGTAFTAIGEINDATMDLGGNTLDVTKFGDDDIRRVQGLRDCSWSLDGFYDAGDTAGQVAIRDSLLNDTPLYIEFLFDGTAGFKQQVVCSKYTVKGAVADTISVSITLDGSGAITAI